MISMLRFLVLGVFVRIGSSLLLPKFPSVAFSRTLIRSYCHNPITEYNSDIDSSESTRNKINVRILSALSGFGLLFAPELCYGDSSLQISATTVVRDNKDLKSALNEYKETLSSESTTTTTESAPPAQVKKPVVKPVVKSVTAPQPLPSTTAPPPKVAATPSTTTSASSPDLELLEKAAKFRKGKGAVPLATKYVAPVESVAPPKTTPTSPASPKAVAVPPKPTVTVPKPPAPAPTPPKSVSPPKSAASVSAPSNGQKKQLAEEVALNNAITKRNTDKARLAKLATDLRGTRSTISSLKSSLNVIERDIAKEKSALQRGNLDKVEAQKNVEEIVRLQKVLGKVRA